VTVETTAEGWTCRAPSWRFDLAIEADLLEELGRVYGYNRLPASKIRADVTMPARPEAKLGLRELRRVLLARDFHEAVTYSFVDADIQKQLDPALAPVVLSNPISPEHAVMRSSVVSGLLRAAQHNVKRQQARVRLFESGLRFVDAGEGLAQTPGLALLATGPVARESWAATARDVDFFDLKGDVEALLARGAPSDWRFVAGERPGMHPGQTAWIECAGQRVGYVGALHPTLQKALDFERPVVVAEIDLAALMEGGLPAFRPVSRFPALRRDLALVVDQGVSAGRTHGDSSRGGRSLHARVNAL
jgi:phenylalanyl-tRNA synthetase beta chain